MKKSIILLLAVLFTISTSLSAQRGTIQNVFPLAVLTPTQIMQTLQSNLDEQNYSLIDFLTYKNYSVQAIKIIYHTIDGQGDHVLASGVVFLPAVTTVTLMPVFSYLHGTLTDFAEIPSNLTGIESITGWIMAMDGYIAVLPDYIGMGVEPGFHPYCHAATEASASIDLLKAVNILCSDPSVLAKPNGNLYLSGYSQGAHAALATQRELEKNPLPFLTLRKTVAGGGAYSLSNIQKNFILNQTAYSHPSFIPYLLLGYQEVYGNLYSSLSQVFKSPYSALIPGLFNGTLTTGEIDSNLPASLTDLMEPAYLRNIKYNYFHPANAALRDNDLINWKPKAELKLYYCTCDDQVAKENSMLAYLSFIMKGSRSVTCLPVGPFNHVDCAPIVLLLAKIQFDAASGVNHGGLLAQSGISPIKSAPGEDLELFKRAMSGNETLDLNDVYANSMIADYLANESGPSRSLAVYPNPATDQALIEIPEDLPANSRILVYDVLGQLLLNENITSTLMNIDVRSYQKGLYKIVLTGGMTYTGKLIVNR